MGSIPNSNNRKEVLALQRLSMQKLLLLMLILPLVTLAACAEADSSTDSPQEKEEAGQAK